MSQFYQYNWPACNAGRNEIALQQNVAAGGNVLLNGSYGKSLNSIANGMARNLYITIGDAVGNVTFTVIGTQNGAMVTDSIIVLNVNPFNASGITAFETITSITANIAVANVIIGVGLVGFMPLILVNTEKTNVGEMSFALSLSGTGTAIIYQSLANLSFSGLPYAPKVGDVRVLSPSLFPWNIQANGGAQIVNPKLIVPLNVCQNILIEWTATGVNSTLQMQFLQI